jgi:transposase
MMRPVGEVKVYLHREPIDMRRGRNGLAALVREGMQQDPFAPEALYVFIGRRFDTLKILGWDRNGYAKPSTKDPRCRVAFETTLLPVASLVWP